MKLRTLISLSVLLTPALAACDQPSADSCDVVVSDGFRGVSLNGKSLNGVSMNGEWLNGKSLNGKSLNGKSLNGKSLNGKSLNGRTINGKSLNGVSLNGVELSDAAIAGGEGALENVELGGTALIGTTASGTRVAGQDWVGAVIHASVGTATIDFEIASVESDASDPAVEWYVLEYEGEPLCGVGGRGLFIAGVWDATGARHDALERDENIAFTFACETGVLAKCIDWGYAPYTVGADAHQTCTRLARADYCGDGLPHTVDGTLIDVFDTLGVQQSDVSIDLAFEAGWGPDGAVCVSRERYVEFGSDGQEVAVSCWDDLPVCDTADEAISSGATLMNRSAPQTLCHE